MNRLSFALIVALIWMCFHASAQSQPNSRNNTPTSADSKLNFSEGTQKKKKRRWWQKKNPAFRYNQKVEEYQERVEDAVARNKKMSKEMEKPQYSDPTYFGHRRPPKKNPVGKKKYCKECGIVH
jgi:hypothetical protein